MGLSIESKSGKRYKESYGALHHVRFMAYRALGGQKDYINWHMLMEADNDIDKLEAIDAAYYDSLQNYPNLIWHSDCDGEYTPDGSVDSFTDPQNGLSTGNSTELLQELQDVREKLLERQDAIVTVSDWHVFNDLYEVVEDIVQNHDGIVRFR